MIPKEKLARYQGLNQLTSSMIMMVGPIISGLLLNIWSLEFMLWIDIGTFFIAVILLLFAKIPSRPTTTEKNENMVEEQEKKGGILYEFKEGLHVFRDVKGLSAIFFIGVFGTFCLSPFNALLTYFINVDHGGSIQDMTIVTIFIQVSLVVGSIIIMIKKNWKRKTAMMVSMTILLFTGNIIMALSPDGNFIMINIGIVVSFLGLPAFSSMFMAIMDSIVPIDKMGRFSAFRDGLISIVMPLGILISGPLSKLISTKWLLIIAAGLGIVVSLITFFVSNVRSLDVIQPVDIEKKDQEN
jgi:DHA3 family macrolide efflux protein-like MFS transporter